MFTPWNDLMTMTETNTKLTDSDYFLIDKIWVLNNNQIVLHIYIYILKIADIVKITANNMNISRESFQIINSFFCTQVSSA